MVDANGSQLICADVGGDSRDGIGIGEGLGGNRRMDEDWTRGRTGEYAGDRSAKPANNIHSGFRRTFQEHKWGNKLEYGRLRAAGERPEPRGNRSAKQYGIRSGFWRTLQEHGWSSKLGGGEL